MSGRDVDRTSGDPVADLVRLAGGRRPAPPERAARVRAAVHATWQAEKRRRRRRRTARAAAAAAVILVAVALAVWRGGESGVDLDHIAARVVSLDHGAWQRAAEGGEATALDVGGEVPSGREVATEERGRLALSLASGTSLRLDVDTRVTVLSGSELRLARGAIYVDAGPDGRPGKVPIEIVTDWGVIRDVGTQFDVRLTGGSLHVRVREGLAILEGDGPPVEIAAGTQVRFSPDGTIERSAVAPHGPAWAWAESIAPMFGLEGSTAGDFLGWIARERGWQLRFVGPRVAESAASTVLSGSLDGVGLDDALDVVLPTCNLSYRLEGNTLVVGAGPEGT